MPKPTKEPLEKDIQRLICDYLAIKQQKGELIFWRNNNTAIYDQKHHSFRAMPKYTPKGLPDIEVIKDGWWIGLEVKRKGTYQSPGQKDFQALCESAGAEYHVVRTLEDVTQLGL
jgi:hypothetical protein